MKKIIFILAVLPLSAFAQKATQASDPKLKSIVIHYENMVLNYDNVKLNNKRGKSEIDIPGPGAMNIGRDEKITLVQKAAQAAKNPNWDKPYMIAECVRITCPAYPDLRADNFAYDTNTAKAKLSGHVTIMDQGAEKPIGETVCLYFSDDDYKILSIK